MPSMNRIKLAVLVSGSGTTLQNMIDLVGAKQLDADIRLVVGSRPELKGLARAQAAKIMNFAVSRHDYEDCAAFSKAVFADGVLPTKMKQIIAVAVAHVTQCPYCIKGHTKAALHAGATPEELMEAVWVASEMRAGGAYAHSALMLDTLNAGQAKTS